MPAPAGGGGARRPPEAGGALVRVPAVRPLRHGGAHPVPGPARGIRGGGPHPGHRRSDRHRDAGGTPELVRSGRRLSPQPSPGGGRAMRVTRTSLRSLAVAALALAAVLLTVGRPAQAQSRQETLIIARNIDDYVTNDVHR